MIVSWFSGGVSSAVALWLSREIVDKVVYIDIDDHHADNLRFLKDVETWIGKPIEIIRSKRFSSVEEVVFATQYVNGPGGASCTNKLKKQVRKDWERENPGKHTYIWGYDANEIERERRLVEAMPEHDHLFPLIEHGFSKEQAHGLIERLGIRRPITYDLGMPNGNCIGCLKGGKGYWNLIRELFPGVFRRRAKMERAIGRSCINGIFLDELEPGTGKNEPVMSECGIVCFIESEVP